MSNNWSLLFYLFIYVCTAAVQLLYSFIQKTKDIWWWMLHGLHLLSGQTTPASSIIFAVRWKSERLNPLSICLTDSNDRLIGSFMQFRVGKKNFSCD